MGLVPKGNFSIYPKRMQKALNGTYQTKRLIVDGASIAFPMPQRHDSFFVSGLFFSVYPNCEKRALMNGT